jgi:hypothetical protein
MTHDMRAIVGTHDLVLVTLDTLRFDVAAAMLAAGRTPNLARVLPPSGWERRHSPGSFTYAAHCAFFAGFLPTPSAPGRHPRPFAMRFEGSETTAETTCVLDAADLPAGLRGRGYHTACIGGVGFFNRQNPLGNALPSLFDEAHWSPALGVRDPRSTEHQVEVARDVLARAGERRVFLFLNVSAIHQPNCHHLPGRERDDLETHAAALAYVDGCLSPLFSALAARGPSFWIVCSDHGTAYGDDGYSGHRLAHPVVWEVPYADFVLPGAS